MEKREFGLRLRELRGQAGLSQRELADRLGVDFSYLSKIENGVMPPPSEGVILKLAEVLNADRDELLTLAGKVPSDIAQILKNREVWQSLREDGTEKKTRAVNKRDSFNKRLRELREQAGLSQRELADKVGVNFTYLSKIESGVKPPPSEKVILKLAESLNCDKDELMTSAGKIPSDIARILKSREVRQSLRENRTQKMMSAAGNRKGVSIMKYLMNSRSLARAALAIVLVGAISASLWFASPLPVQALKIDITNTAGAPLQAGTVGQTYYFQTKVTIESNELMPIQNIGLSIFNSANASGYRAAITNLPLNDGGSANYTNAQTGGGSVNVTATALNWNYIYSSNGSVSWNGTVVNFGYGYGYGIGPSSITYTIAWTPPSGWPVGGYKIETTITANNNVTFTQLSSEFTLQTGLMAETSISQALNTSNVTVVKVNIDRIKNPSDNATANITGGIGSYTATVSGNASSNIQFLAVNGVPPFTGPSFNATTGVFSVAVVSSPIQANNTTVAEVVPILTGNSTANVTLTVTFQIISAAGQPGLSVPEEHSNTIILLRGDADKNGVISVVDSLAIKQYLVGQLTLTQINPLNAATPVHDGTGGDKINVVDALAIEQLLVGQIGLYYQ